MFNSQFWSSLYLLATFAMLGMGILAGGYIQRELHGAELDALVAEVEEFSMAVDENIAHNNATVEEFLTVEAECETLAVSVPSPYFPDEVIYIGAIDLCGRDLEWSNIYGPFPQDKYQAPPPPVIAPRYE